MIYQLFNSIERGHYHCHLYNSNSIFSHFHEYFEVIYIVEGNLSVSVNNKTVKLEQYDMAVILPNQIHSFKSYERSVFYVSLFSADLVAKFASDMRNKVGTEFILHTDDNLSSYFKQNFSEACVEDIYGLKSFVYKICELYTKQIKISSKNEKHTLTAMHKIIEYVSLHFKENITLKHLAEVFGYNQNYLSRIFNQSIGINFKKFLNEFRIEYAKTQLLETDNSISQIAFEAGYETIRNFNRAFLTINKMTPNEFRNRLEDREERFL